MKKILIDPISRRKFIKTSAGLLVPLAFPFDVFAGRVQQAHKAVITAKNGGTPTGNSDTFTGSDDTALATHDANWGNANSTYTVANMEIISNRVQPTGNYSQGGARYTTSTSDTCQFTIPGGRTAGFGFNHIFVRGNGTVLGYGIGLGGLSEGNWLDITYYKNGSQIDFDAGAGTWAAASDHILKIVVSGTSTVTISAYVDGVLAGTTTDSTDTYTSGNPGFIGYPDGTMANSTFDNFQDY